MPNQKDKLPEWFEKWVEWKLYKVLYIGIVVPLFINESKKWIFKDFFISVIFFAAAIFLLLPTIFKISEIINILESYLEK